MGIGRERTGVSVGTLRTLFVCLLVGGSASTLAVDAPSSVTLSADIEPGPVTDVLTTFGRQTSLQLIYVSTIAETLHSKGARAGLTASAALTQLLDGTGLTYEFLNPRTIRIFAAPVDGRGAVTPSAVKRAPPRLAFALEEVMVTATRREESSSRVPIDMAVLTEDAMRASGVNGMADFAAMTPAMQFEPAVAAGEGFAYLTMRGVAGRNASTTGLYLDDTPIPPVVGDLMLSSFPVTFDVNRIEVLRGPQIQLFGEGNEGGAIRFLFNQPSLSVFTGLATGGFATTRGGAPSYEVGLAFGGPLAPDAAGFRISAWGRSDGGYVDRVDQFTGITVDRNANHSASASLRGALTLAPRDGLQITPSLTYMSYGLHDQRFFLTDLSDVDAQQLKNGSLLQQPYDVAFYLGAVRVSATLGAARLTAVSSYFDRRASWLADDTGGFDWGNPLGPGYPVSSTDAIADHWDIHQRMLMQEVRLTSSDSNDTLRWDAAAFYSGSRVGFSEHLTGALGVPGVWPAPTDLQQVAVGTQSRLAVFGELSFKLTKQLTADVAVHGERTHYRSADDSSPNLAAAGTDSAVMPRVRLAFQATERELLYLTLGKGYGSSGPLPPYLFVSQPPAGWGIDTLSSYEVGTKSTLVDGRMQLETGFFHIAWEDGAGYYPTPAGLLGVPGRAASNGFDVTAQLLPSTRLKLDLGVAYTDARYTRTITQGGVVFVRAGQAVNPGVDFVSLSPWNVSLSADYLIDLGHDLTADLRADGTFRSQNPGPFAL